MKQRRSHKPINIYTIISKPKEKKVYLRLTITNSKDVEKRIRKNKNEKKNEIERRFTHLFRNQNWRRKRKR